jgi:splicing factor U2AF 65 kDa subunit
MVTPEELQNPNDYQDIFEETEGEARKFGRLQRVIIPRNGPGVGRVFLHYAAPTESMQAFAVLNGRKFSNRTVEARFYDEKAFSSNDYAR